MTEASAVLTVLGPEDHRAGGDACCARPAGRCSASTLVDPGRRRQRPSPPGETGEVCARGGNFMREYWNRPEATAEAFRDGWYHTGDAGYLDERGLPVPRRPGEGHDRHRRRERVLGRGRERDRDASGRRAGRGDRHPARAVGRGGARDRRSEARRRVLTEAEIIECAKSTIAGYKVPKSVEFRTEPLPLSGALKPLKRELRRAVLGGPRASGVTRATRRRPRGRCRPGRGRSRRSP